MFSHLNDFAVVFEQALRLESNDPHVAAICWTGASGILESSLQADVAIEVIAESGILTDTATAANVDGSSPILLQHQYP